MNANKYVSLGAGTAHAPSHSKPLQTIHTGYINDRQYTTEKRDWKEILESMGNECHDVVGSSKCCSKLVHNKNQTVTDMAGKDRTVNEACLAIWRRCTMAMMRV